MEEMDRLFDDKLVDEVEEVRKSLYEKIREARNRHS